MEKRMTSYHPSLDLHSAIAKNGPSGTGGRPGSMLEISADDTYIWGVSESTVGQRRLLRGIREQHFLGAAPELLAPIPEPRSVSDKLGDIQTWLGVNVSVLSKMLKTSRSRLYAWFEGENPNVSNVRRIEKIYEIAVAFHEANTLGFEPRGIIRQSLPNGSSWQDALMESDVNVSKTISLIPQVIKLMQRAAEQGRKQFGKPIDQGELDQRRSITDVITGVASAGDD